MRSICTSSVIETEYPTKKKKGVEVEGSAKSSVSLDLGTYEAARIPLAYVIVSAVGAFACTYTWPRDKRTSHLPFLGNYVSMVTVCMVYCLFSLTWGPKFMQNRPPIKPKKLMMVYNLTQVVFCSYIFYESGIGGWFFDYNWRCQQEDRSYKPKTLRMVNAVYLYYISKILDFTDTVFLVLGKRWSSVSLLHVLHHSIMYLSAWQGAYYAPAGHLNLTVFINSFVHVLMYTYYFLAALGKSVQPYLWWKKYLTTIQITQFIVVLLHAIQIFFRDCPDVSKVYAVFLCFYAISFTALFVDFYKQEYKEKR